MLGICGIKWGVSKTVNFWDDVESIHGAGSGQSIGKTVAIIVGGTACVGFLIICVLFVRGLKKRDDGM